MTFDLDAHFQADEKQRDRSRPVRKYSPSQPRDDQGRWTDLSTVLAMPSADLIHDGGGTVADTLRKKRKNAHYKAIRDRVKAEGFFGSVVVDKDDGVVLDGHHRIAAAEELGLTKVPVKRMSFERFIEQRDFGHLVKYSPSQPRDERGRWTETGTDRDSYGGGHAPPSNGAPLHDLLAEGSWFPDDVYSSPEHYGHAYDQVTRESVAVLRSVRGKPDAPVTVYRAVPPDVDRINTGDWVALSRSYAEEHAAGGTSEVWDPDVEWELDSGVKGKGEWVPGPPWKVISTTVPARLIRNGGNDIIEWGYWGDSTVAKYDPNQPRDSRGRWTDGFGGDDEGVAIRSGDSTVLVTSDVVEAAEAIAAGRKVMLTQKRQVSVLLDHLADLVADARAAGKKAPNYNLCNVTVAGTNVFCVNNKGIPRVQMPQLKGVPLPGSKADALPRDRFGEVTLTEQFRQHLITKGVAITDTRVPAAVLKATQNELNGGKVAAIADAYEAGELAKERLFVSRDDYVVDGHHRWASILGVDYADNRSGDHFMDVAQIDMGIIELLDESNRFAAEWGIPQAGLNAGFSPTMKGLDPFGLLLKYSPSQPRDERGRWTDGSARGWTTTITDHATSLARIEKALPHALVSAEENIVPPGTMAGIAEAAERFVAKFPNVAKEVVLVRVGTESTTTAAMAETIITTVRKPDGSTATGIGFLVNSTKTSPAEWQHVHDLVERNKAWGEQTAPDVYERRTNVFPILNHPDWVASSMTHEFGHAVHMVSTAKGLGQPLYSGTGKNEHVWSDVALPGVLFPTFEVDNGRLRDYVVLNADPRNRSSKPPPSVYAGGNMAELFAESFAFRHGPKGSGVMRSTTLDPELEAIVMDIEKDAR